MSGEYTADERENKLTPWVRNLLGRLRSDLELAKGELETVTAENERLRKVIEDKYGTRDDSDTFLVNEDTGAELPLGQGATIHFGNFFEVRYDHHKTAGARALIIETDDPLQIRPTGARDITITRA